jgi:hypothetical protein
MSLPPFAQFISSGTGHNHAAGSNTRGLLKYRYQAKALVDRELGAPSRIYRKRPKTALRASY